MSSGTCDSSKQGQRGWPVILAFVLSLVISAHSLPSEARSRVHWDDLSAYGQLDQPLKETWSLAAKYEDLLAYMQSHVTVHSHLETEKDVVPFNRLKHFGRWINADPKVNCLNTRFEVLIRDAAPGAEIEYKPPGKCAIRKGLWRDPYSGEEFKMANAMQVDHVVPLKYAYVSGAHAWKFPKRCHYYNYLGNNFHLLAVSGHENMSKNSGGPENYMPPDETYHCQYLNLWMKIKAIWSMTYSEEEASAIERMFKEKNCSAQFDRIPIEELNFQRTEIEQPVEKCVEMATAD